MTDSVQKETHSFQTEVKQMLNLMIHSMYTDAEVFLRELISNGSDAIEKARFESIENPEILGDDPEFKIHVMFDKDSKTITISDNGIGMTRDDVISHLGTIARSGTREKLAELSGDAAKDSKLIGQFGVGFYSAFIVAHKVTVLTRQAGQDPEHGVIWESSGDGEYEIANYTKLGRGTDVILHIRDEQVEFLDDWRLRSIITKYSDHIDVPIVMPRIVKDKEKDEETITEEVVNKATALWTLPKNKISDDDYKGLYKHIAHDYDDPLFWLHNRVEGSLDYTSLLYVPKNAPFDLWNRDGNKGLKLYVRRVFIMDDAEQFMPSYLRFVKGVLDTNALPLNISREILQNNRDVTKMRTALTKRVLDHLEKLAKNNPEEYQTFWDAFGQVLKEAPAEDFANRERVAKLLRFSTTNSAIQKVSLEEYIAHMPKEQEKIYYITADTYDAGINSPHLEIYKKKNIEVLLLTDKIDEWLVVHLTEFEGKSLQSVAKGDVDISGFDDAPSKEEQEKTATDFSEVLTKAKESLGDRVKDVRVTYRLTDSPACVVVGDGEMGAHMQRILQAAGQQVGAVKPILELNPHHPLVEGLKHQSDAKCFDDMVDLLLGQAILAEGGQLENPALFVKKMNAFLSSVS